MCAQISRGTLNESASSEEVTSRRDAAEKEAAKKEDEMEAARKAEAEKEVLLLTRTARPQHPGMVAAKECVQLSLFF